MNSKYLSAVLLVFVLALASACAAETEAPETGAPEVSTAPQETVAPAAAGSEDLTGLWEGDWGPNERDRNRVSLDLNWDGSELTGTINPGSTAIELTDASYNPETGEVTMQAEAQSFRGGVNQYMIEGTVEGDTISGTWEHQTGSGDFQVARSE